MKQETVVISLGGSVIVPRISDEGGLNVAFLKAFKDMIVSEIKKGARFVIVAGGGKTSRAYQKDASVFSDVTKDDLDWIGIQATRLNAFALKALFGALAYGWVIDGEPSVKELRALRSSKKKLFLACGWKPGQSSDYEAVALAKMFGAKSAVNASNIEFVYDKDPSAFKDAKAITEISWKEYRRLIPAKWTPGLGTPFDPVASRLAQKEKVTVKIVCGTDLTNFRKAICQEPFSGTVIG
ncbi:MAG: UMP kinase [Candidatus Wildermuthbacteria bacterium]|nr:UMP kinase [Candidatus Wildermuthbacteria bacterium]